MITIIRSRTPLNWLIVTIVSTMVVIFSVLIIFSWPKGNSVTPITNNFIEEKIYLINTLNESGLATSTIGLPVLFAIPTLNIMVNVESVGLTSDGAMDVPKGPDNVAWYDLGPRPGEVGNAVISGHYGWKNNIPAVFDNLSKLQVGDQVFVEDDKRVITTFIVRKIETYSENQDAYDVFISGDGKAHLNLVTCQGVWNKDKKSYSERLVIFTDMEISTSSPLQ